MIKNNMSNYLQGVCLGLILLNICPKMGYAQSSEEQKVWYNVVSIPPSPNAASLGKYGEVPVDKSTGIPSISIPLLQLSEGGIDVPISLSYHAGGIKVQEEASWVGLGWSLNAGGVITRTVRGLPDDAFSGFLQHAEVVPAKEFIDLEFGIHGGTESIYNKMDLIANGKMDYEPDAFFYNYGKSSGQFMFGNNRQTLAIPYNDVNIEPVFRQGKILGFILTDPNGLIYIFGDVNTTGYTERTEASSGESSLSVYISSWYLQKIYNPLTKSEIQLTYTSDHYSKCATFSETITYEKSLAGYSKLSNNLSLNETSISDFKSLSQIKMSSGVVNFHFSSVSQEEGTRLDSITFHKRRFDFHYDFTTAIDNDLSANSKRLRLGSIEESGQGITRSKKYWFEYNTIELPTKDSKSIDHWGYYNGESNVTLIPKMTFANIVFKGANREPNPKYCGAGMLSKINYPTGGWSEFGFENNTYAKNPTIDDITTPNAITTVVTGSATHGTVYRTKSLFITTGLTYYDFFIEASLRHSSSVGLYEDQIGHVTVESDDGKMLYEKDITSQGFNLPLSLPPSSMYIITVSATGSITSASVSLKYKQYNPSDLGVLKEFRAGGVRVKQIKSYDPVSSQMNYLTYEYGTNGYLTSKLPSYYTMIQDFRVIKGSSPVLINRVMFYSTPASGMGSSPNSVSYQKVIEYSGTPDSNNGKVETTYYYKEDLPVGGTPYIAKNSIQWLRRKVIRESFFRNIGLKTYDTLKINDYFYEIDPYHSYYTQGFKASRIRTNSTPYSYFDKDDFIYTDFKVRTDNVQLSKLLTKEFFNGFSLITEQNYHYDNPLHINPTRIETFASNGRIKKTSFKYPLDYSSCKNNCEYDYYSTTSTCKLNELDQWAHDIEACRAIYGSCYASFADCMGRGGGSNCQIAFDNNLKNKGYYDCRNALRCKYNFCLVDASSSYLTCKLNYNNCLQNQFNASTDPYDKGIYLMALYNIRNTWVEKLDSLDGKEIEHYRLRFNPINNVPLLVKAEKEINGQGFTTCMTYDKYDEHLNIAQVTVKEKGSQTSYKWGYNGKYLVVKAENVNDSTLSAAVIVAINSLNISTITTLDSLLTIINGPTDVRWRNFNDNLRVQQSLKGSMVTTYTYAPFIGITSQTDPMGMTTYYEYDEFGRLTIVRDRRSNLLSQYNYRYYNDMRPELFFSSDKSGIYTKNSCAVGGVGGSVTYTVNAGAYTSTVSQADADVKAQNDVNTNGQAYANNNGTCTFSSVAKSGTFTKNNCAVGGVGVTVTYTLNAGAYTSTVSQVDADAKAQTDVNATGQAYANANGTCTFSSVIKSGIFTKNNCATGEVGSSVTYTVLTGKYTSTISQSDADTKAQNDVNTNGQAYANANGTCYYLNLENPTLNFDVTGGTQTETVTSNTTYSITSNVPWVTVSPSNASIGITCSVNNSGVNRTGSVTIQSASTCGSIAKNVIVSQSGPCLTVSIKDLEFRWLLSSQIVSVSSSSSWSITSKVGSFITATKVDEQTLKIQCIKNSSSPFRNGSVTITNGSQIVIITVSQATNPALYPQ